MRIQYIIIILLLVLTATTFLPSLMFFARREFLQEKQDKKSHYKILALGDYTLPHDLDTIPWPDHMQSILESKDKKTSFEVVKKGWRNITSKILLESIDSLLSTHNPDIVVTLVGKFDQYESHPSTAFEERFIPENYFEQISNDNKNNGNLYKIYRRLREYIKILSFKLTVSAKTQNLQMETSSRMSGVAAQKIEDHVRKGQIDQGLLLLDKALEEYAEESQYLYAVLQNLYLKYAFYSQAEEFLKQRTKQEENQDKAYFHLGSLYKYMGVNEDPKKLRLAETSFKNSIELNPENDEAYLALATVYKVIAEKKDESNFTEDTLQKIEALLTKAIQINPNNRYPYIWLGSAYLKAGKHELAEKYEKMALELRDAPGDYSFDSFNAYMQLGKIYFATGKYLEAEDAFKNAYNSYTKDHRPFGELAKIYTARGDKEKADEMTKMALELLLARNYRMIESMLSQKNITLVAVQYPLESVSRLEHIVGSPKVLYVENQKNFKEAIKKGGNQDYFIDGNLTTKAHYLLADNIVDAILKNNKAWRK